MYTLPISAIESSFKLPYRPDHGCCPEASPSFSAHAMADESRPSWLSKNAPAVAAAAAAGVTGLAALYLWHQNAKLQRELQLERAGATGRALALAGSQPAATESGKKVRIYM